MKGEDNMENKGWGRTILSVYNYLETVTEAIDKVVKARAVNGFYYNSATCGYNDIYSISEHILNLTERKVNLINLKILCEDILEKMNLEYARILISNFIDKRRAVDSAEILGISLRSYFRKLKMALASFESELAKLGYNDKYLYKLFKNEEWIMEIKHNFDQEDNFVLQSIPINNIYNQFSFSRQIHSNLTF